MFVFFSVLFLCSVVDVVVREILLTVYHFLQRLGKKHPMDKREQFKTASSCCGFDYTWNCTNMT